MNRLLHLPTLLYRHFSELPCIFRRHKIIIYTDGSGSTKLDVRLEDETLWLTQAQLCSLYKTSKSNVSEHIKHIFEEDELQEDSVVRKFRTAAADGKMYLTTFYNLDMIIALGYRVHSIIATRFRQWANTTPERIHHKRLYNRLWPTERGWWRQLLERVNISKSITVPYFYTPMMV